MLKNGDSVKEMRTEKILNKISKKKGNKRKNNIEI